MSASPAHTLAAPTDARNSAARPVATDTTFEAHYTIGDLAKQWRLGRETVRLLMKDEPGIIKIRLGVRKAMTRYSVPESVARRVHTSRGSSRHG
jgi:hypothetical protein